MLQMTDRSLQLYFITFQKAFSRPDCHVAESHVRICFVGIPSIPTNIPTFGPDTNRRPKTLLDALTHLTCCMPIIFLIVLDGV
jgi:hypothetical protein